MLAARAILRRLLQTLARSCICVIALACASCVHRDAGTPNVALAGAELLWQDDFQDLSQWILELEKPGSVRAMDGALDIDVPAGATLWFKHELAAPVAISFAATAIDAGGPNDRVSDINVFWMARNSDGTNLLTRRRHGAFAEYNDLLTYYVGLGGNWNTTTRFRRYIGDRELRPLRPEHDLSSPDVLLRANHTQNITLITDGKRVEYWRDGVRVFQFHDAEPYGRGHFAIRTTRSHLRIEGFRIHRL